MPRRIVDISASVTQPNSQLQLETDLQKALKGVIQGRKAMTLGYAIHILTSVDVSLEGANSTHGERVVQIVEQFRDRIHVLADGRVKAPVVITNAHVPIVEPPLDKAPVDLPHADPTEAPLPLSSGCKTWNAAQILSFLEAADRRPPQRGSLRRILEEFNVPEHKYHYWKGKRDKLRQEVAEETAPLPPRDVVIQGAHVAHVSEQPIQWQSFDGLDELGCLPEVVRDLGTMLHDPMLQHLADVIALRHEELLAKWKSQQDKPMDSAQTEQSVSSPIEGHVSRNGNAPSFDQALPVVGVLIEQEAKVQSLVDAAVVPPDPIFQKEAVPAEKPVAVTTETDAAIEMPAQFGLVREAPQLAPRLEEDRRRDFTKIMSLRLLGSVRSDWTYEHAIELTCERFASLVDGILRDEEFVRSVDSGVPYEELSCAALQTLEMVLHRYDPNRDGDLIPFLLGAIRDEMLRHPLVARCQEPDGNISREKCALRWADAQGGMRAATYFDFVGAMLRRHMRWVFPLVEGNYNPQSSFGLDDAKNAGYQELKRQIKEFDFTDDVTHESFRDSIEDSIRAAVLKAAPAADRASQTIFPLPAPTSPMAVPTVSQSLLSDVHPVRPPAEVAAGVLKTYLLSAQAKISQRPDHQDDLQRFAAGLGIHGDDHVSRVAQVAGKYFYLADEAPKAVLPSGNRRIWFPLRDAARYAIVRFLYSESLQSADTVEPRLWEAVLEQVRTKISQMKKQ